MEDNVNLEKVLVSRVQYIIKTTIKVEIMLLLTNPFFAMLVGIKWPLYFKQLFLMIIFGIVISAFSTFTNYQGFVRPINMLVIQISKIYKNDLTYRADLSKAARLKKIFEQLNWSIEKLSSTIKKVLSVFQHVISNSHILRDSSEQITNSTEQIAAGIEQVAEKINLHSEHISEISDKLELMSKRIINLKQAAMDMNQKSNAAGELSIKGQEMINSVKSKMEESYLARNQANNTINTLDNKAKEITLITDTIIGISEQTNLLALNAAIESARAGEYGSGFAVVSEEIRKLAEQSSSSVKQIMTLINEIQAQTQQTVEKISDMGSVIDDQNQAVEEASEIFLDITGSVKDIAYGINSINSVSEKMNISNNVIVESVNNILSSSEQVAATAEEIAASTQEQNASIQEISQAFQFLYTTVEDFNSKLQRFNI